MHNVLIFHFIDPAHILIWWIGPGVQAQRYSGCTKMTTWIIILSIMLANIYPKLFIVNTCLYFCLIPSHLPHFRKQPMIPHLSPQNKSQTCPFYFNKVSLVSNLKMLCCAKSDIASICEVTETGIFTYRLENCIICIANGCVDHWYDVRIICMVGMSGTTVDWFGHLHHLLKVSGCWMTLYIFSCNQRDTIHIEVESFIVSYSIYSWLNQNG